MIRKNIYLSLLLILPFFAVSQTLFRTGTFLHHSTGLNIWGPNGSATSIPQETANYNAVHGYTGTSEVDINEQWWPSGGDNEWEFWHRIFDNEVPGLSINSVMNNNKIVVIKSCFPSSEMTATGQASDTLTPTTKSVYNHKWHWRNIISVMASRPQNFFAIWTNAPHVQGATNPIAAGLSKKFTTWAKDTLAMGLDPEFGAFPPNVYVFHYFSKLTDANGYELPQYAISNSDSHPNGNATALVAPQFVNEIFNAAIAYEAGNGLSVTPASQAVSASAGSVNFNVVTNNAWSATSSQPWCTVTSAGSGSGVLTATFNENHATARSVTITVSSAGLPNVILTINQAANPGKVLNLNLLLEGLYASNGQMNQAYDESGPRFRAGIADHIEVELHSAGNYNSIVFNSAEVELSTSGSASVNIPQSLAGSYYITVKHRNSIETTTTYPVSFAGQVTGYSFNQPSKAYGNNLKHISGSYYAVYGADVDQNGIVDTADITGFDNLSVNFAIGYFPEDVNGDGSVDTADITTLDNNQFYFVGMVHP
ncbi:MAG: BACON domain-containing carbohydrate-binding protein [Bacteroidota bacterium]